jgi:hypothetical protein
MDPVVESALISAVATLVGVGGTAAVAITGFRNSRSTNQATIDVVRDTNKATIDAAHVDVQRTVDTTHAGQIADLYSRAIEQLGSGTLDVRLGGIYALERVARDSAEDHPTVIEVLAAFIRQHSHEQWMPPDQLPDVEWRTSIRPDIQAALTVLGRRESKHDIRSIDLSGADLTGANLTRANLGSADLTRANLTGASLGYAHLICTNFVSANLASARLDHADLSGARLCFADLRHTNLARANFTDADLHSANLSRAHIGDALFTDARLTRANLTGISWPGYTPIPEGWERDSRYGVLKALDVGDGVASTDDSS